MSLEKPLVCTQVSKKMCPVHVFINDGTKEQILRRNISITLLKHVYASNERRVDDIHIVPPSVAIKTRQALQLKPPT